LTKENSLTGRKAYIHKILSKDIIFSKNIIFPIRKIQTDLFIFKTYVIQYFMENGKIFISYRREDTSGESGRLKDNLEQIFGKENIFYDVETLEAGLNFDQSIAKALSESKVLLAMIGPHWMKVSDSKGIKRLQKPEDWVRKEIAEAIKRDLRVIPILVNGAEMPDPEELPEDLKELSLKHAQELTSSRWNYDVGVLSKVLEKLITKNPESKPQSTPDLRTTPTPLVAPNPEPKKWWAKNYVWAIGGIVGFVILFNIFPLQDSDESADSNLESEVPADNQEYIPELNVKWTLIETRNKVEYKTTLIFKNREDGIYFLQYLEDSLNGEGKVQIDNQNLVLMYTDSNYDPTGKLIMETTDYGQTWQGKSTYPSMNETYNSKLLRN